jgi:hypothetical protein
MAGWGADTISYMYGCMYLYVQCWGSEGVLPRDQLFRMFCCSGWRRSAIPCFFRGAWMPSGSYQGPGQWFGRSSTQETSHVETEWIAVAAQVCHGRKGSGRAPNSPPPALKQGEARGKSLVTLCKSRGDLLPRPKWRGSHQDFPLCMRGWTQGSHGKDTVPSHRVGA